MQYIKKEDGTFALLPKQNVDFGGGLERIAAAAQGNPDVFAIDVFADTIDLLIHFSGKNYTDSRYQRSFRIVADHIRAATFMLEAGVRPSNTERDMYCADSSAAPHNTRRSSELSMVKIRTACSSNVLQYS